MNWLNISFVLIAIYLAAFAEAAFAGTRLIGAQIDLLPGLIVYAGLTFSFAAMVALAVFAGLVFDTLSANPLGVSVLPLLLVGTVVFHNQEFLLRQHAYAQFVLGCLASAVAPLLALVVLLGMGQQPLLNLGSLWQMLVMSLGGGLMTPVWFKLFSRLGVALHYPVEPEEAYREDRQIKRGRS